MSAQLKETDTTEISLLPEHALANPAELFTRARLDEVIEQIRAAVQIVPDLSTEEGRKLIASTAYKVARSKTAIDAVGKGMTEDWKKQAKVIDGLRKHSWDTLESLQAAVRAPLTEWEGEQKRIEQEAIEAARQRREAEEAEKAADLARREAEVAEREARLAAAEKAEADRLAKIESERIQAERDDAIRQEAIAQAELAEAERTANAARCLAEAAERAEKARTDAIEAARVATAKAEADKAEAVRQAEQRIAQQAAAAEQARKDAEAKEEADREKREANRKHCGAINSKAAAALVAAGLDPDAAKLAVTAIASGKIPAVSIAY